MTLVLQIDHIHTLLFAVDLIYARARDVKVYRVSRRDGCLDPKLKYWGSR